MKCWPLGYRSDGSVHFCHLVWAEGWSYIFINNRLEGFAPGTFWRLLKGILPLLSDEAFFHGVAYQFRRTAQVEFIHQVLFVELNGFDGDLQGGSDFFG